MVGMQRPGREAPPQAMGMLRPEYTPRGLWAVIPGTGDPDTSEANMI